MTSYKVMSSSLTAQPALEYLTRRTAFLKLLLGRVNVKQALDLYFLVRNPYEKLVSFFSDKFSAHPGSCDNSDFSWQHCQKIFFHELGLTHSLSKNEKANRFINTSFSDFVEMLPRVYRRDSHLHPQSWLLQTRIGGVPVFQPKISRIIRIDTQEISFLSEDLQLDMTIKGNVTEHPPYSQMFTSQDYAIINSVYAIDFDQFEYAKH